MLGASPEKQSLNATVNTSFTLDHQDVQTLAIDQLDFDDHEDKEDRLRDAQIKLQQRKDIILK